MDVRRLYLAKLLTYVLRCLQQTATRELTATQSFYRSPEPRLQKSPVSQWQTAVNPSNPNTVCEVEDETVCVHNT